MSRWVTDQVHAAAAGGVRGVRPHAGLEQTVCADRDAGSVSYFAESAVAVVVKQKIRHMVIGNEDVLPAVIVIIKSDHAQAIASLQPEPGMLADIGEGSVAIVVIERRRLAVKIVGMTVASHPRTLVPAVEVALRRPVDVVGNDKIQVAVIVVVEPCGARCPAARIRHSARALSRR